jgi:hypothetical protein
VENIVAAEPTGVSMDTKMKSVGLWETDFAAQPTRMSLDTTKQQISPSISGRSAKK